MKYNTLSQNVRIGARLLAKRPAVSQAPLLRQLKLHKNSQSLGALSQALRMLVDHHFTSVVQEGVFLLALLMGSKVLECMIKH